MFLKQNYIFIQNIRYRLVFRIWINAQKKFFRFRILLKTLLGTVVTRLHHINSACFSWRIFLSLIGSLDCRSNAIFVVARSITAFQTFFAIAIGFTEILPYHIRAGIGRLEGWACAGSWSWCYTWFCSADVKTALVCAPASSISTTRVNGGIGTWRECKISWIGFGTCSSFDNRFRWIRADFLAGGLAALLFSLTAAVILAVIHYRRRALVHYERIPRRTVAWFRHNRWIAAVWSPAVWTTSLIRSTVGTFRFACFQVSRWRGTPHISVRRT